MTQLIRHHFYMYSSIQATEHLFRKQGPGMKFQFGSSRTDFSSRITGNLDLFEITSPLLAIHY